MIARQFSCRLSTGDFAPALEQFLSTGSGLSPTSITRLTGQWQDELEPSGSEISPVVASSTLV